MPTYMKIPLKQITVTHGGTDYTFNESTSLTVLRRENAFDIATVLLSDYQAKNYSAKVSAGDAIKIEVKDRSDASWTAILKGKINVALPNLPPDMLILKCNGSGYGFGATVCAEEYGDQSTNPTINSFQDILQHGSYGIINKWVNEILGSGSSSGYNYTTEVENKAGTFKYLYFPYKPCDKAINDVCEVMQAMLGTYAGMHWIVNTNDKFIATTIGSHHAAAVAAGWDTYYGGSQANATFEQGKDFTTFTFQELDEEANHIIYYGTLRKPATEIWTENNSGSWGAKAYGAGTGYAVGDEASTLLVGSYSLRLTTNNGVGGGVGAYYPSAKNASWDVTNWGGPYSIPKFNFNIYCGTHIAVAAGNGLPRVEFHSTDNDYFSFDVGGLVAVGRWQFISFPIGPYAQQHIDTSMELTIWGSPNWNDIDYIEIVVGNDDGATSANAHVDGLFFSGKILRIAKNSTKITDNKLKSKTITDDEGKDDSGKATDDTGTIALLAYAELLRCQTKPLVGTFIVPMVKDLLPGQLVHTHAKKTSTGTFRIDKDMRVTKLTHNIASDPVGFQTQIWVTDDVKNSICRSPYNALNKVLAAVRPEFQDRQATSIKTRDLDITLPRLEKDYPS